MDVYACGVALFAMLMGFCPFENSHLRDPAFSFVRAKGLASLLESWGRKPPVDGGLDMLSGMLSIDPIRRLTTQQVLDSPWFDAVREADVPRHR